MTDEFTNVGNSFFDLIGAFLNVLMNHWMITLGVIFVLCLLVSMGRRR